MDKNADLLFEHRFWLQILGDHSRFILNALAPSEEGFIKKANMFKIRFDKLLERSRSVLTQENLNKLTIDSFDAANELRQFKLNILSNQIVNQIAFNLPPTFVNHMINELEEYLYILSHYINNTQLPSNALHLHLLWLPDGAGHASYISSAVDMTEKDLIKMANIFSKYFENLYLKAIEFKGYTRTKLYDFPALNILNEDANMRMINFEEFLEKLKDGISQNEILGILNVLVPDHMFREECYYQIKLSKVSSIVPPRCDPARPRVNV